MPDKKVLSLLLAAPLRSVVAVAQDAVEPNPDHPPPYIVKRGDTLWDISTNLSARTLALAGNLAHQPPDQKPAPDLSW